MPSTFRPSPTELQSWLHAHGVDTSTYGTNSAKSLTELADEMRKGETTLTVEQGAVLRQVEVVNIYIVNERNQVLMEAGQVLPDGRSRERGLPVAEKMLRGEDWLAAARRAVAEELGSVLGPGAGASLQVESSSYHRVVEVKASPSYPGVSTKYTLHRVRGSIAGLPEAPFTTTEPRHQGTLLTHWMWLPAATALPPQLA